ncbi:MAG: branched-chain amino acid ABC transporter permease, partial [Hydrogenobacter thermophilus]|nr:branched-chain amino acid ABC transporter permease [Hydrogenobacter thermophilus]
MEIVFQLLLDALLLAGFYSMLSSGFSLMWGVTGIINLAYGSFVLLGAYLLYTLYLSGVGLLTAFFIVLAIGLLSGAVLEMFFFNKLMNYETF